ncbi:MAG: hypothetical protein A3F67_01795 [Verrucomicrobia bacterium RIFCSPHIGHO2_12_FULL_41_10]|nr:MAG: hypothetical protein A3F67_01795 [Verrucomicrobia bacterium RIFCSPHIGHO2_12_FULL_41_10]HLB34014.1 AI-2E family transporter [Chthoniobacterales bacterium]
MHSIQTITSQSDHLVQIPPSKEEDLNASPTPFQRKVCWTGLTTLAALTTTLIVAGIIWALLQGMSFLQPVLMPVAIAAILSYLLNPVVEWLCRRNLPRTVSVITVFAVFILFVVGIIFWVEPAVQRQGSSFAKNLPAYSQHVQDLVNTSSSFITQFMDVTSYHKEGIDPTSPDRIHDYSVSLINEGMIWIQQKIPTMAASLGKFVKNSIGGFLGIFGYLISFILVPIFLFFFLLEAPDIKNNWSNYLPLRPSPLKDEVVSLLLEINNYIIFFFRGQLLVSLVDGAMIAASLMIFVHLDFAILIGVLVGILGLIPYAGIIICWVPAVLIAAAQFGDWWHPILVTLIFFAANNFDSIFVSPKILGHSVGLHPLTVILSVLCWSMILGGLLGALLAVPLTASLMVLMRRYVWRQQPFISSK